MADEINLGGAIYVSSKRAAALTGYAQDYVGQLARTGAIEAKRVSGLWYILQSSILSHKEKSAEFKPEPPKKISDENLEVSISFDGNDYISAKRASEITGYSQDYVGQLARSGKIVSRQVGNRWFVQRQALIEHKKEKDALLAAVQRDAVGLSRIETVPEIKEEATPTTHFTYYPEGNMTMDPSSGEEIQSDQAKLEEDIVEEEVNQIPIRIVETPQQAPQPIAQLKLSSRAMVFIVVVIMVIGACIGIWYFMPPQSNVSRVVNDGSAIRGYIIDIFSETLEYNR